MNKRGRVCLVPLTFGKVKEKVDRSKKNEKKVGKRKMYEKLLARAIYTYFKNDQEILTDQVFL